MTDATTAAPAGGRLMQLLRSRGGTEPGAPTMVLQHREALTYTLGKAAALEQLVMCQYLYAAFAMKDRLVFLDFITDQTENVFPMVPGGKGISEMILSEEL